MPETGQLVVIGIGEAVYRFWINTDDPEDMLCIGSVEELEKIVRTEKLLIYIDII